MASIRLPFPQVNTFRDWVSDELEFRRGLWPTPISSPFARLTSCSEDKKNNYKYFTLGLHGFDRIDLDIFDQTYGSVKEIVGHAVRDGKKTLIGADEISFVPPTIQNVPSNPTINSSELNRIAASNAQQSTDQIIAEGSHPIPGIVGMNVKRTGLAAPLVAEIYWNCYNKQQLEFLRNHFMIVGRYVVIEWGQQYSNRQLNKVLDFTDSSVDQILVDSIIKGRRYIIDNYEQANDGNYDYIVGGVGNFTVEMEAHTNIYKCSTRLVSLGENIWGINLALTFTNQKSDPGAAAVINDLHSYFTSGFDQLLGKLVSDNSKYIRPQFPPYNMNVLNAAGLGESVGDPLDRAFISWKALTEDVMNDMNEIFNAIPDSGKNVSLQSFRRELRSLLSLGSPPLDTLPADVKNAQQESYDNEWVGNNPFLRSVDPDSMIIITPDIAKIGPAKEWLGNGTFGDSATPDRGKLTSGVWLNAHMVRNAFLDSTTLQEALTKILSHMNESVADYWQLQLYYDDELAVYKVIDYQFSNADNLNFYEFNAELDFQHNETLEISLDTAFPPELIVQMSAIAMIQSETPDEQSKDFQNLPLLNTATPFMFAVNWTSIQDLLKQKLDSTYKSFDVQQGNSSKQIPAGVGSNDTTGLPTTGRLLDNSNKGPFTGNTPMSVGTAGAPRTTNQSIATTNQSLVSNTEAAPPLPRTTPLPPPAAVQFKLDSLPVTPIIITSRFGSRTPPKAISTGGPGNPHRGVDIGVQFVPVHAVKSGVVTFARLNANAAGGNSIHIDHGSGFETRYFHLKELDVTVGDHVSGGQQIAVSGNSGTDTTGPHLHFEVLKNGSYIDPEPILKSSQSISFASNPSSIMPAQDSLDTNSDTATAQTQPTVSPADTAQTPKSINSSISNNATDAAAPSDMNDYLRVIAAKFGEGLITLIWPSKSILRQYIVQDGYSKLSSSMINGFISPYPTKTAVEIKLAGLSGISISDGFLVGKLPFIFANYGVFQVTEITDSVSDSGWFTSVRGYFKLLWPLGRDT